MKKGSAAVTSLLSRVPHFSGLFPESGASGFGKMRDSAFSPGGSSSFFDVSFCCSALFGAGHENSSLVRIWPV
jgi:hypothetical protein